MAPAPAAERAAAGFAAAFGGEPDGVWTSPGRVNLIGEHVDYAGGLVLPYALPQRAAVAARRRGDGRLRMAALDLPGGPLVEVALAEVRRGRPGGWSAYVAGVGSVLAAAGWWPPDAGLELALASDVPSGSGLSSSAAIECAALRALAGLGGFTDRVEGDPIAFARLAQRAENEVVGVPCGLMDQAASLGCIPGHALLLDCRDGSTRQVPFDPAAAGLAVVLIDSGVRHRVGGGPYAERRASVERAATCLAQRRAGASYGQTGQAEWALREATRAEVEAAPLDEVDRRRALHVVDEIARVRLAVAALDAGRVADLGPLLTASHASLRDLMEVSCPELDATVAAAMAGGALGARLVGAGFGGYVLALVRKPAG
jgi:galactokinase